jgi:hypothetical protein
MMPEETTPLRVDLPFDGTERLEFQEYLKKTGRKAGPWLRVLALEAIEKDRQTSKGTAA